MAEWVINPAGFADFATEALALASGSVANGDDLLFSSGDHACVGTSHTKSNLTYRPLVDGQVWALKRVTGTGAVLTTYTGFDLDGGTGGVTVSGGTTYGITGNGSSRTMTLRRVTVTGNDVGVYRIATGSTIAQCKFHGNTVEGVKVVTGQAIAVTASAFYDNGGDGLQAVSAGNTADRCDFYANNTAGGVAQCNLGTAGVATECIAEDGAAIGIKAATAVRCSSTGNGTDYSVATNTSPIAGPAGWADAATGDFSITIASPAYHAGQPSAIVSDIAGVAYHVTTPSIGSREVPDSTSPVVEITSTPGYTNASYTLAGTFSDTSGVVRLEYDIDGGDPVDISPIASPFSVPLTLAAGAHTITVEAEDEYGNTGSDDVEVFVDTDSPAVAITSGTEATQAAYELAGTATDSTPITALVYRLNGGPAVALELSGGVFAADLTLREGRNTIIVTATDSLGKTGFAVAAVTVTLREAWLPNRDRLMSRLPRGLRSAP
ncbi:MAG: right-handed parallel beta-helix repeat-containing protein [Dehalococcoidia bacterium]